VIATHLLAGCNSSDPGAQRVSGKAAGTQAEVQSNSPASTLEDLLSFDDPASNASGMSVPQFRDVAEVMGVRFRRFNDEVQGRFFLPEVMGGGIGWIDVDHDGRFELYATNGCPLWDEYDRSDSAYQNRLFRNLDRKFNDITSVSGTGDVGYGHGCAVGDMNADGFVDLYVTNFGRNTLLQSNGDGTYHDNTSESGVECNTWSTSAVWFDANSDRLNDLYVTNYLHMTRENHQTCNYGSGEGYCGPGGWDGVADVLYLNVGDGTFREQSGDAWGVPATGAKGLAVATVDFDDDRIPEVYVGNDMMPNFLLRRKTDTAMSSHGGIYENIASIAGCAVSYEGMNEASMGIACSDFDTDGRVDIFLTHYYESKNTLYRNLGNLLFEDASRQSRIAASSFDKLGFGTVSFDSNRDGADDIFVANGHVLGPNHFPNEMTAQILLNDGSGTFTDVSASCGPYFEMMCLGRGAAGCDFDNDGLLDVAVSHLDQQLSLLHNDTNPVGQYLGIELLSQDRCHPVGARIRVQSAQIDRTISVIGGGSYLSANDPRLLVAVGPTPEPLNVVMEWPSGRSVQYENLTSGRYWTLTERGEAVSGDRWLSSSVVTGGINDR
jgi:hypothetical protein